MARTARRLALGIVATFVACSSTEVSAPPDGGSGGGGAGRVCTTEQCDELDNDCDGAVDEGCACDPGAEQRCYSGNPTTVAIGRCTWGAQRCVDGGWAECVGEVLPAEERCSDGIDDDCDGAIDESCPCTAGDEQACYPGNPINVDVGRCTRGSQSCDGDTWGACTDAVTPGDEQCNGTDDDCDGATDEGCGGAGGAAGAGGAGGGLPTITCPNGPALLDDFGGASLSAYWTEYGAGTATVAGGTLFVQSTPDPGATGVRTNGVFDLTGCTAQFVVPEATPAATVGLVELLLWGSDSQYLGFVFDDSELNARVVNFAQITDTIPYDPGATIWLRVRETGGLLRFESSLDGADWTGHLTTNTGSFVTAVRVDLRARNTAASGTASTVRLDDVTLAP